MPATLTSHAAPAAPVPPLAPLHNPLTWLAWVFAWVSLTGLLLPFLVLPISLPVALGCALFGWPLTLGMGSAAICVAFYCRAINRRLRRFQEGHYLVRWLYTPDEWESYAAAEAERVRGRGRGAVLLGLCLGVLPGLAIGGSVGQVAFNGVVALVVLGILGGLAGAVVGATAGWLMRVLIRSGAERTRQRILRSPRQAYIGADAAWCGGMYISWTAYSTWLAGVRMLPGEPAMLEFTAHTQIRDGHAEHRVCIPLPYARHAEAVWLITALSASIRR